MHFIAEEVLTGKSISVAIENSSYRMVQSDQAPTAGFYLSPGWVDIQVNGFAGNNLSGDGLRLEDVQSMNARLRREGLAAWCPTLVTAETHQIEDNLRIIAKACDLDPALEMAIPGFHLEGPYISSEEGARGAHPRIHVHPPDWDEFQRWQEAAHGRIRLITLAPEQPGAMTFIRKAVRTGVVVAIGHTAASTQTIMDAVDAGASLSTHLGNGIASNIHRHENPLWCQLADDRLYASLIFDGFHLPGNMMRVFLRAKGIDRCVLVSDAVSQARMPAGVYQSAIGGKVELHENGCLSLYGTEYLAGSASSLKDCIEVAVQVAGCTLEQVVKMVSLNPWRVLNLPIPENFTLFFWDADASKFEILALIQSQKVMYVNRSSLTDKTK
jgi:N-acetylglucosamine-6-phosphate deacetylase